MHLLWKMPHNHDKKNSKILEYPIDLNFLKKCYQITECTVKCNCSVYLTFLLWYPCLLELITLVLILLEKNLKITHKTLWHIYTRPPIGVTPSECLISCKICSDKISLKLRMRRTKATSAICGYMFMQRLSWQAHSSKNITRMGPEPAVLQLWKNNWLRMVTVGMKNGS